MQRAPVVLKTAAPTTGKLVGAQAPGAPGQTPPNNSGRGTERAPQCRTPAAGGMGVVWKRWVR